MFASRRGFVVWSIFTVSIVVLTLVLVKVLGDSPAAVVAGIVLSVIIFKGYPMIEKHFAKKTA